MLAAAALAAPIAAQQPGARAKINAVATFSILGDLVKNVGGDRLELSVLVGPNGDSHVYSPSSADARTVREADIVFENGLGFEGWIERLVESSGTRAKIVVASKGVQPIEADEHGHHDDHDGDHKQEQEHAHDHDIDPHAWQSVRNAKVYVANIRDGLIAADPEGAPAYRHNAAAYLARLDALDERIRATVAAIPPAERKIITSHDAFGYFAREYGVDFIALQGVSSDTEASAKDVAAIIRQIKRDKIPAVFVENIADPRLMQRIAEESGARIGERVYSDSLSDGNGPARTYIEMMEHNISAFAAALKH